MEEGAGSREKFRKAKTQQEPTLATTLKDKEYFSNYFIKKWRAEENLCLLLDAGVNKVTKDEAKADELNAFFASVFHDKTSCYPSTQLPELFGKESCGGERDLIHH